MQSWKHNTHLKCDIQGELIFDTTVKIEAGIYNCFAAVVVVIYPYILCRQKHALAAETQLINSCMVASQIICAVANPPVVHSHAVDPAP